jgi:glycosyltransferase involved in cell wall biosynthesis
VTNSSTPRHLFLTTEIFYPDQIGGGFLQFVRYAADLRENGVIVHVCTALRAHHTSESEEWNSVNILRFPGCEDASHRRERELILGKTLELIEERYRGASSIQPNGESWGTTLALAKARLKGIPATFYFSMFPPERDLRGWARLRASLRITLCLLPFRKLIFCSSVLGEAYRSLGNLAAGRMAFVPNGVDLERFRPARDAGERAGLRRELGLPEAGRMILYVGGFMPRKGCDVLLEAWNRIEARHPDAFLVCVGSQGMRETLRDPAFREEMEKFQATITPLAEALASRGRVMMTGEVGSVESYYRAADLFVFPSRREGLPNAALEAMSSGLPCLFAPFHGFPPEGGEFGHTGREFRKVPHDVALWEKEISAALDDAEGASELGRNAREWMVRTQDWKECVSKLARVYRRLPGEN